MTSQFLRASLLRGGTSKGVFFSETLPTSTRDDLLRRALGSPDPTGMQMNGIGGGISSASKVAFVTKSQRPGIDVDYLFGQVALTSPVVDWSGSCGNLAAGVGLFALHAGLVSPHVSSLMQPTAQSVRVWQENLGYEIVVDVPLFPCPERGVALVPSSKDEYPEWMTSIAGIPGREPKIAVNFIDPNNGETLLPSTNSVDRLTLPDGRAIDATLILSANPTVFVRATDIGLTGSELPSEVDYHATIYPIEQALCRQACAIMGIEYSAAVRLSWLATPEDGCDMVLTSGDTISVDASQHNLIGRITTEGRVHHAFTGTGAINLGCAVGIPGSIPHQLQSAHPTASLQTTVLHPAGIVEVEAHVEQTPGDGKWCVTKAGLIRTSRVIMEGMLNASP